MTQSRTDDHENPVPSGFSIWSLLLWSGLLGLGVWLWFEGLAAHDEASLSRQLRRDLEQRVRDGERTRDDLDVQIHLLEGGDPAAVKGALQDQGYVEEGRTAVKEASPRPRGR